MLHNVLSFQTSNWECSLVRGLGSSLEKCHQARSGLPKQSDTTKYRTLARCGYLPSNISKEDFKKM